MTELRPEICVRYTPNESQLCRGISTLLGGSEGLGEVWDRLVYETLAQWCLISGSRLTIGFTGKLRGTLPLSRFKHIPYYSDTLLYSNDNKPCRQRHNAFFSTAFPNWITCGASFITQPNCSRRLKLTLASRLADKTTHSSDL